MNKAKKLEMAELAYCRYCGVRFRRHYWHYPLCVHCKMVYLGRRDHEEVSRQGEVEETGSTITAEETELDCR